MNDYIEHGTAHLSENWTKQDQKEYNAEYYRTHKDKWTNSKGFSYESDGEGNVYMLYNGQRLKVNDIESTINPTDYSKKKSSSDSSTSSSKKKSSGSSKKSSGSSKKKSSGSSKKSSGSSKKKGSSTKKKSSTETAAQKKQHQTDLTNFVTKVVKNGTVDANSIDGTYSDSQKKMIANAIKKYGGKKIKQSDVEDAYYDIYNRFSPGVDTYLIKTQRNSVSHKAIGELSIDTIAHDNLVNGWTFF